MRLLNSGENKMPCLIECSVEHREQNVKLTPAKTCLNKTFSNSSMNNYITLHYINIYIPKIHLYKGFDTTYFAMIPATPKKRPLLALYSPTHPLSKLWKNQVNLHWLVSPTHAARFPGFHIKGSGHLFCFYKVRDLHWTWYSLSNYFLHHVQKRRQAVYFFTLFPVITAQQNPLGDILSGKNMEKWDLPDHFKTEVLLLCIFS